MAVNIGNQFNYGREEIGYGKVPLWDRVDEQYPSGVYVKHDEEGGKEYAKLGALIPAGTPVQVDYLGAEPKIGEDATDPTGLTRYDATIGTDGATLTVVTRGAIYEDRVDESVSLTTAKTALAGRILFIKETTEE